VSAVVIVVLLVVGTLSVLTLHSSVTGIINSQLSASLNGFSYSVTKYRITPAHIGALPPRDR
jgi:two-component system sensor histidine kinase TrcS